MADPEMLRQEIRRFARDGKAACRALLELADRTGTPPAQIGRLCNEMNVKIHACQLGCFH